jgi:hypothetical protein
MEVISVFRIDKTTQFKWQETLALLLGIATLVAGGYLGYTTHPDWVGRAGSLLIVYGVLLATTRKFDLLHTKVLKFLEDFRKKNKTLIPEELPKLHQREPTCCETLAAELDVYQSAIYDIAELIDERRRAFKVYEISLVIVGTLVNGFGPWLISYLMTAV